MFKELFSGKKTKSSKGKLNENVGFVGINNSLKAWIWLIIVLSYASWRFGTASPYVILDLLVPFVVFWFVIGIGRVKKR